MPSFRHPMLKSEEWQHYSSVALMNPWSKGCASRRPRTAAVPRPNIARSSRQALRTTSRKTFAEVLTCIPDVGEDAGFRADGRLRKGGACI